MNAMAVTNVGSRAHADTALELKLTRWTMGLVVASGLGTVCGLCGLAIGFAVLTGLSMMPGGLSTLGAVLVGAAFPLFLLAAHCMDKIDEAEKEMRIERAKETGFKGDWQGE